MLAGAASLFLLGALLSLRASFSNLPLTLHKPVALETVNKIRYSYFCKINIGASHLPDNMF